MQGSFLTIQGGFSARRLSQNPSRGHPWRQPEQEVADPSGTMTDVESTEVVYLFELVSTSVLVANCMLLQKLLMLNISFGCCRHSVSNTSVQLTEGRSARDQPKQLPAKKKH